jgi:hypothetical protein
VLSVDALRVSSTHDFSLHDDPNEPGKATSDKARTLPASLGTINRISSAAHGGRFLDRANSTTAPLAHPSQMALDKLR